MLDKQLKGPRFKESDHTGIQVFMLKLSQVHKRAIETKPEHTFSTTETFDEILRSKLPFFSKKWAEKYTDTEEKIANTQDYSLELTFGYFLEFCRRLNNVNITHKGILKNDTATSTSSAEPNTAYAANGKSGKKIAATEVDVAATTTSKPKNNNRPSFLTKKAPTNQSSGQEPRQKPKSEQTSPKSGADSCLACNNGMHALDACRKFLKKDDEEKRLFVQKKGICYLCLKHGHMATNCPSASDI